MTTAALALAGLLPAAPASAVTVVTTANGAEFTIHDAHRPSLDTGSIRSLSGSRLEGFGNIFLQVTEGDDRMNGQMLRGFGLTADGSGGFDSTRSVLVDGVQVARDVTVETGEDRVRFLDSFTNTTDATVTVRVSFGGTLGYGTGDDAGVIIATADGDTDVETSDTWVVSAAADRRPVGIVVGEGVDALGDQQADPFSTPYEHEGSRANHPGFVQTLEIAAGETQSLLQYVIAGGAGADALGPLTENASDLADDAAAVDLDLAMRCSVVNWSLPGTEDAACDAAPLLPMPSADLSTLTSEAAATTVDYDVTGATIERLQMDMRSGMTTSVEITQAYLDRISAYDGGALGFHSFITVADDALAQAAAADAARAEGADSDLLGIPLGIKDLYDTFDMPTTGGTRALEDFQPAKDAWQVARLREAGAVIIGKTNMSEFAYSGGFSESGFMQTWNALYPSKTSHGSSGGSGAAVAADLAAAGMGSQTGVSLYAPSTSNGLATFRGTDGLSSTSGVQPLTWGRDFAGPMAKTVTDLSFLLDATSSRTTGNNPDDLLTSRVDNDLRPESFGSRLQPDMLDGKVLGIIPDSFVSSRLPDDPTGPAARARLEELAEAAGAEIVEVPEPESFERSPGGSAGAEGWARYIEEQESFPFADGNELTASPLVLPYNERSQRDTPRMTEQQVTDYLDWRDRYKEHIAAWMADQGIDAVVYPGFLSAVGNNDVSSAIHTSDRSTGVLTSTAGLPTVVVPVGASPYGQSMSLQIVGPAWTDDEVLGMGYALEQGVAAPVATTFADALPADIGDVTTDVKIQTRRLIESATNTVTVRVVARGGFKASGTVVVEVAGRTLTTEVEAGVAVVELPDRLEAGRHQMRANYIGDTATEASSTVATLRVAEPRGRGAGH
ncbi:amidase family protein [Isoptericola haloaureus]|uniref:Amidase family protein n=1 Tax=Isoptericola haloaureus TaxID=1542902 RepID=A0ABU7Z8Z7_9MICO